VGYRVATSFFQPTWQCLVAMRCSSMARSAQRGVEKHYDTYRVSTVTQGMSLQGRKQMKFHAFFLVNTG